MTRAPVREMASNDGGRNRRSDATRLLRNALIDLWNHPKMRPLSCTGNRCFSRSLIRSREVEHESRGANVRAHNT